MMKHHPAHPALINYIFHCLSSGKDVIRVGKSFHNKMCNDVIVVQSQFMNERTDKLNSLVDKHCQVDWHLIR